MKPIEKLDELAEPDHDDLTLGEPPRTPLEKGDIDDAELGDE